MSMNPGATTQPEASSSRSPCRFWPTSSITPAEMATSATRPEVPVPSMTVPPRMTMSAGISTSLTLGHEELCLLDRRSGCGSAVNRDDDAGDLRRPLAGQEEDGVGDVSRSALTLERLRESDDGAEVVVGDAGADMARCDAVHADAVLGQVGRRRPAELDHRGLGDPVDDRQRPPGE